MQTERIKVYIRTEQGRTVCICLQACKRCGKDCEEDEVERDKYRNWEQTFKRNRYGK